MVFAVYTLSAFRQNHEKNRVVVRPTYIESSATGKLRALVSDADAQLRASEVQDIELTHSNRSAKVLPGLALAANGKLVGGVE